jgi:hypothetical protein
LGRHDSGEKGKPRDALCRRLAFLVYVCVRVFLLSFVLTSVSMPPQARRSHKGISKATIPSQGLPKAWPENVTYLNSPVYSKNIERPLLCVEKGSKEASELTVISPKAQAPCQLIRIRPISNPSHPANGQFGLFATQNLLPGTFIIVYLGYVHDSVDTDPTLDYDLRLNAELGIAVDASRMGNEARFINDYRGVSDTGPNAEFRDVLFDQGNGVLERRIGVFVLSAGKGKSGKRTKGISKGEEILVSYGKGFWQGRKKDGELEEVE